VSGAVDPRDGQYGAEPELGLPRRQPPSRGPEDGTGGDALGAQVAAQQPRDVPRQHDILDARVLADGPRRPRTQVQVLDVQRQRRAEPDARAQEQAEQGLIAAALATPSVTLQRLHEPPLLGLGERRRQRPVRLRTGGVNGA
jgi:hypothetical protein